MRVAALYDIHGNLPALEAVLGDVRSASVDQVVIGGDVFPGPMSGDVLACLLDLEIPVQFIQGNGDREGARTGRGRGGRRRSRAISRHDALGRGTTRAGPPERDGGLAGIHTGRD